MARETAELHLPRCSRNKREYDFYGSSIVRSLAGSLTALLFSSLAIKLQN
jgi:hypothetical protein